MTNTSRRIWADTESGTVCLRDEDDFGNEIVRQFWVPPNGGYVREVDARRHGTLGQQVCGRLSHTGSTLSADPTSLMGLIRREYRRGVARAQREARS